MRFSERTWEGALFRKSGFYTSCIRFLEMLNIFDNIGFECTVPRKVMWGELPVSKEGMAPFFQALPLEDLLVNGFDVVLRHKGNT